MSYILIVAASLWLSSMVKHGSFSSTLPIGYRIQASLLTLFLIYGGMLDVRVLGWSVFHPNWFVTRYWQSTSFLPAGISAAVAVVSLLAGIVWLFIGFQISQRKLQGFNLAVRCAPLLLLIALLDFTRAIGTSKVQRHVGDVQATSTHDVFVRGVGSHILQNRAEDPQLPPYVAAIATAIAIAIIIAFYYWLYRFAKSPKNRQFIKQDNLVVKEPTA